MRVINNLRHIGGSLLFAGLVWALLGGPILLLNHPRDAAPTAIAAR
jgi:hypothetical protein